MKLPIKKGCMALGALLFSACGPLLQTAHQETLPVYAPLATGQSWLVEGQSITFESKATVRTVKLWNAGGLYSNASPEDLVNVHKGNAEPVPPTVEYSTVRQQMTFKWRDSTYNYTCITSNVKPSSSELKGIWYLAGERVGTCTAKLQAPTPAP